MIFTAITRANSANEWQRKTSAELAIELVAPVGLRETRLTTAFQEAVGRGASLNDLGKCYSLMNNEFVINLRDALHDGDLVQVQVLTAIAAGQLGWSEATAKALNETIAAHTMTLIEQVADEVGQTAPEVSTAAVSAALIDAGFVWSDVKDEWERG